MHHFSRRFIILCRSEIIHGVNVYKFIFSAVMKTTLTNALQFVRYFNFILFSFFLSVTPPFPQIDIIGDVVIVWRVRGKTIRSVLCNIVCNNCAQCNAHTYEHTNSSLDWVLSHWAHFTVLDSFLYCVLLCVYA